MITFEHTNNLELIRQMLTVPACYIRMADDAAPKIEFFAIDNPARFIAVVAREGERPIGIFILFPDPHAPGSAEVHFCFQPCVWGRTQQAARMFLDWVWRETSLNILIGPVPSHNALARELAESVGFEQYDILLEAGTKHGKPFDRILMIARRPHAAVRTA